MKILPKTKAISETRLKMGYTLRGLAQETHLTPESILRIEHGRPVRPGTAKVICTALGAEFCDLFWVAKEESADDGKAGL